MIEVYGALSRIKANFVFFFCLIICILLLAIVGIIDDKIYKIPENLSPKRIKNVVRNKITIFTLLYKVGT